MSIDLLNLEPHVISRDLKGKIVVLYGEPKVGKTTTASQFPKTLLCAFEKGYNALSGVIAQNINKWAEFKQVLKQLEKEPVKEKFSTIVIDTADIAYNLCEKYICSKEGVEKIGDIPYGAGYKMVRDEFDNALRSVPMLGYGLVMISHAQLGTFTDEQGVEYTKTVPTLAKNPRQIVLSMADIIGYAKSVETDGELQAYLFLRGTSRFEAGSRFKFVPEYIPFEYEALVNTIADAIEKEEEAKGQTTVKTEFDNTYAVEEVDFESLKESTTEILNQLLESGQHEVEDLLEIVAKHLGKGNKVSEAKPRQVEALSVLYDDLKDLLESTQA